jgi:cytochrome c-type biogenesis protein CcmE
MSQKTAKVGITVLVLATAFGVLLYTSLGESMQFYKYTDEVMANPTEWQGKNLQVHGYVVPNSIAMKPGTLEYRFDMQRNGKVMRAFYTGIVPDTFKNDSEVVLTGRLTSDGFHATDMTAKCPSKYDAAPANPTSADQPNIGAGQTGGD